MREWEGEEWEWEGGRGKSGRVGGWEVGRMTWMVLRMCGICKDSLWKLSSAMGQVITFRTDLASIAVRFYKCLESCCNQAVQSVFGLKLHSFVGVVCVLQDNLHTVDHTVLL